MRPPFPQIAEDVRRGLTSAPKELPPKYFYDERGSELFEQICELPEYYLTRTERRLLEETSDSIVGLSRPTRLVEFGSGSSSKTRILLDAMQRADLLDTYVPIDISEIFLHQTTAALQREYPQLKISGVVGDFEHAVQIPPHHARQLVGFLGSTIGNLTRPQAVSFLSNVARLLRPEDTFLLGTDLVKDTTILERAYNDRAGVTAAFNRNVLEVINENLGANFVLDHFEHLAFYNRAEARIEMHLVASHSHQVCIQAIDLLVNFDSRESIRTEISCKYTRAMVEDMLDDAGLQMIQWITDADDLFALSLSRLK